VLISGGVLSRRGNPAVTTAAFAGGLIPDLKMFVLFAYDRFVNGLSRHVIWGERYWTDTWQIPAGISHSFPLYGLVLAAGLFLRSQVTIVYALSSLLHCLTDFLVHAEDAHMQLLPVSRWALASPISYWDPRHYGAIVSKVELAIGVAMILVMWRRFPTVWARAAVGLALVFYAAVPLLLMLTHHM
jgi:hypothetical protein